MSIIKAALEALLVKHNGRRQKRLLNLADLIRLIGEALHDGAATTGGGTVANSYGYPALQTVACAVKRGRWIYLAIGEKSASKGTSQVPYHLGLQTRYLSKWDGTGADLKVSTRTARILLREVEREITAGLSADLRQVRVTKEDSYSVGNCATYTDLIAARIGKESATGEEVFDFVAVNFPSQLARAVKAIEFAASKV